MPRPHPVVAFVQERLAPVANPDDARSMQAYLKTEMPILGVHAPDIKLIAREAAKSIPVDTQDAYEQAVSALWRGRYREHKWLAVAYARRFKAFIVPASLPLYERMIREGAWWDLVDETAIHLVGKVLLDHPRETWPVIDSWIDHEDLWLRRTALICQNRHHERTDQTRLFRYCLRRADEREFFIRKAIGWALRAHSYHAPEAVKTFLLEHRHLLSGLSYREGAKALVRGGAL